MTSYLVPALHDLAVSVAAPAMVLSRPDGQLPAGGVTGWIVDDVRLLDELVVSVDGSDLLELVRSAVVGADRQEFTYVARRLGGWLHDPTVSVERRRTLTASRLVEEVEVSSRALEPVDLTLHVDLASDLAPISLVRQGLPSETTGLVGEETPSELDVTLDPAPSGVDEGRRARWSTTLRPGATFAVRVQLDATAAPSFGPGGASPWAGVAAEAPDPRLGRLLAQSVDDLGGLLMRDGDDAFLAAGSPWFLTLFGRDSLWAARLTMPFGTDLALSTLRALARRQGERTDPGSEEQPGKILHEVRNTTLSSMG